MPPWNDVLFYKFSDGNLYNHYFNFDNISRTLFVTFTSRDKYQTLLINWNLSNKTQESWYEKKIICINLLTGYTPFFNKLLKTLLKSMRKYVAAFVKITSYRFIYMYFLIFAISIIFNYTYSSYIRHIAKKKLWIYYVRQY